MNLTRTITGLLLLYLSLILFSCTMQKKPSRIADHVIIFGIDGLSPDGVQKAEAPNLQRFAEQGAYTWHSRAVMPSSSGANWSSILNGTTVEQHGVFENSWTPDNLVLPPVAVNQKNTFPTIFAAIRKQLPDAETGAFFHWNPMVNFVENNLISRLELPPDQFETIRLASSYLQEHEPDFIFIQLDQVDSAGHQFGHGSEEYYAAVAEADSLIGELYQSLSQGKLENETVIIVTSDHGGIGYGHGGNSPQEMQVPFIVYGKGVKKGVRLKQPVNAFDVPATALFALGLKVPFEWTGRPVRSAFQGNEHPDLMFQLNHLADAPEIIPDGAGYNPPGGLFVNESVEMRMINHSGIGEIRYTMDGSLPDLNSALYSGPVLIEKTTVVMAQIFEQGEPISQLNRAYFRILQNPEKHGLETRIYEIGESDQLPDFNTLSPRSTGRSLEISSNELELPRQNYVAATFEGYIRIDRAGEYRFSIASDDGSKLYLNGSLLIDNDGDHGVIEKSGSLNLEEGFHQIRAEWFNGGGGYWLAAFIEGPGLPRQIIPAEWLYTETEER